ncbi:MAG TPA: hypothetical protein VN673_03310 [Clostridia bacterium]|nr:hypothetical protein [Clostridia bacterium]
MHDAKSRSIWKRVAKVYAGLCNALVTLVLALILGEVCWPQPTLSQERHGRPAVPEAGSGGLDLREIGFSLDLPKVASSCEEPATSQPRGAADWGPNTPLDARVKSADHVFTGVATAFQLLDWNGPPIDVKDTDQVRLAYCLSVRPVTVLKSSLQVLPLSISVTNSQTRMVSRSPVSEGLRFVGKELVYLLTGTNFVPVNAYQFTEPLDELTNINELIRSKNKQ